MGNTTPPAIEPSIVTAQKFVNMVWNERGFREVARNSPPSFIPDGNWGKLHHITVAKGMIVLRAKFSGNDGKQTYSIPVANLHFHEHGEEIIVCDKYAPKAPVLKLRHGPLPVRAPDIAIEPSFAAL